MTKQVKKAEIDLGRRHEWVDTQGHSHKVVFDDGAFEKPRATWTTLSVVAAIALLAGSVMIAATHRSSDERAFVGRSNALPNFALSSATQRDGDAPYLAIAAGWNDEFFAASASGIALFNASCERLEYWPRDVGAAPTALLFIGDEKSESNGVLLVAYADRIDALRFSLERTRETTDARAALASETSADGTTTTYYARTSQGGAIGEFETVLSLPGAKICGMTNTSDRLFVADFVAQRGKRFPLKALIPSTGDDAVRAPDCELGAPDETDAYPGLKPTFERNFCLARLEETNVVYAVSSGLFRIDAFDATSGARRPEASWSKAPGSSRGFIGSANPIAIAPTDAWIAVVEVGKFDANSNRRSPLQFFDLSGGWLAEADGYPLERLEDVFVVALAKSRDDRRLYALRSDGAIDVLTQGE